MKLVEVELSGYVAWRIYKDDPKSYNLRSLPGWSFLNPLTYLELGVNERSTGYPLKMLAVIDESVLLKTNAFLFASPSQPFEDVFAYDISPFVRGLRFVSKQAELSRAHAGGASTLPDIEEIPLPTFPQILLGQSKWVSQNDLTTAVIWRYVEETDTHVVNDNVFLPGTILLDAVQAYLDRDDRRTILYAAMAVEILANTKLTEAGRSNTRIPRGQSYIEALFDKQPLRFLGKSLQHASPVLYQNLATLYATRTAIVHEGGSTTQSNMLPITGEGAWNALKYANDVFGWFGEPTSYLPTGGHVIAQVPVGSHTPDIDGPFPKPLPRIYG